jgi:hypothetical protein
MGGERAQQVKAIFEEVGIEAIIRNSEDHRHDNIQREFGDSVDLHDRKSSPRAFSGCGYRASLTE